MQTNPKSEILTWGLKAGLNYSNLYGKEIDYIFASDQTEYKHEFHAGSFQLYAGPYISVLLNAHVQRMALLISSNMPTATRMKIPKPILLKYTAAVLWF